MLLLLALMLVANGGPWWVLLAWLAWATRPERLERLRDGWHRAREGRRLP